MSTNAQLQVSPSSPPRVDTGGCRQGEEGTFFAKGFVDWELLPFLAKLGLTMAERAATQVAITMAEYREDLDAFLVEWNVRKISKRSATAPDASTDAKRKLEQAGLAMTFTPARKGSNSAVLDITDLIRAKGKKIV